MNTAYPPPKGSRQWLFGYEEPVIRTGTTPNGSSFGSDLPNMRANSIFANCRVATNSAYSTDERLSHLERAQNQLNEQREELVQKKREEEFAKRTFSVAQLKDYLDTFTASRHAQRKENTAPLHAFQAADFCQKRWIQDAKFVKDFVDFLKSGEVGIS